VKPSHAALITACAWAWACNATETGNPVAEHRLALTARSSSDTVALGSAAPGAGLSVDEAWVVIGDIRFVQSADCDSGPEQQADVPGPQVLELIAQPAPIAFAVDEAAYCRVRVPLDRAEALDGAVPAELDDHAILIRGTRAADGVAFVLRSRQTREADIRSRDEPFTLERTSADLILAFDVGRWLEGVEIESASTGADGVVRIDDDSQRDRLDVFEENVEAAMELFRDDDGDGRLDAVESDTPLASGAP